MMPMQENGRKNLTDAILDAVWRKEDCSVEEVSILFSSLAFVMEDISSSSSPYSVPRKKVIDCLEIIDE